MGGLSQGLFIFRSIGSALAGQCRLPTAIVTGGCWYPTRVVLRPAHFRLLLWRSQIKAAVPRLVLLPEATGEQHKHRVYFQSSEHHDDRKKHLDPILEERVVQGRTDPPKAGADIAQGY